MKIRDFKEKRGRERRERERAGLAEGFRLTYANIYELISQEMLDLLCLLQYTKNVIE